MNTEQEDFQEEEEEVKGEELCCPDSLAIMDNGISHGVEQARIAT